LVGACKKHLPLILVDSFPEQVEQENRGRTGKPIKREMAEVEEDQRPSWRGLDELILSAAY